MGGFIYPHVLWLLLALIPLAALWNLVQRSREQKLARFSVRENWGLLNPFVSRRGRFHKGILLILALAFSVAAAARPWYGREEREVRRLGTNVLFAVDVSESMRARDVAPSRLEYAKALLRQVMVESPGNRIGILPFAGDAFLQCPLTTDYSIAQDVLSEISFQSVAYEGTDIPAAIDQAIEAFERSGSGNRILVLLTDGEDHSEAILRAADRAAEEGAPIRLPDGSFKEADDGTKVFSRLNSRILRDLADRTGGNAYIAGGSGQLDPTPVIRQLRDLQKEELGEDKRVVRQERYQWPLALALLCLVIEGLIGERRSVTVRSRGPARPGREREAQG